MATTTVHLGFAIGTGTPVTIPLRHMVVTGQTQEAGKTTTLEALIARAGVRAVAFVTKRGEESFSDAHTIAPYFSEQKTDAGYIEWRYVASILEASLGEKLKFERSWIMRATKGATTLADVQRNVRTALEDPKTRGLSADVYFTLNEYLQAVVPQIARVQWARTVELAPGINAMDLGALGIEMQHLVIRATIDWVLHHAEDTIVVVPEAWKFIPQGRGTPVKLAAEAFIRQAAALRNYLWLDSQDIAGIEKLILKSVPVWILGVQREVNEVKRTLEQMPVAMPKLTPRQVATLKLGEFYACFGEHAIKTYVQPAWMDEPTAIGVAQGRIQIPQGVIHARPQPVQTSAPTSEDSVTPEEAEALREENVELRRTNERLEERIELLVAGRLVGRPDTATPEPRPETPTPRPPVPSMAALAPTGAPAADGEALYQAIKARLIAEAPAVLKVLVTKPEIEVAVTRETIDVDGKTLRGRVARLMADGFLDKGVTANAVQKELARLGKDPGPGNTYNEMKTLAEMGFVTIEEGKDDQHRKRTLYRSVTDMKVRIRNA
jgi:hypothetical protein